jgi:hypothetical protein
MTVVDGTRSDADRRQLEERWPTADAVAQIGGPVRQSMADGGRELVKGHSSGDTNADQTGASR